MSVFILVPVIWLCQTALMYKAYKRSERVEMENIELTAIYVVWMAIGSPNVPITTKYIDIARSPNKGNYDLRFCLVFSAVSVLVYVSFLNTWFSCFLVSCFPVSSLHCFLSSSVQCVTSTSCPSSSLFIRRHVLPVKQPRQCWQLKFICHSVQCKRIYVVITSWSYSQKHCSIKSLLCGPSWSRNPKPWFPCQDSQHRCRNQYRDAWVISWQWSTLV